MVALGGTYLACGVPDHFDGPPVYLKACDLDKHDLDCIDLPGSYCGTDELCTCANSDGSRPPAGTNSDQTFCEGACRPSAKCSPEAEQDAGPEGGQEGGAEASVPEPECTTEADCPGPPDARCGKAVCEEGVCGLDLLAQPGEFVALASQRAGDCQHAYCDASGSIVIVPDGGDVYNDAKQCTFDVCEDGNPTSITLPDGSPCPEGGSGYCYGGECVECMDWLNGANDCGNNQACDFIYCVTLACVANGACGDTCAPCPTGFGCDSHSDCKDGVCGPNGMCELPSCSDDVQNDGETGKDCGAPSCKAQCTDGDGCKLHSDCLSGVCWAGACQAPTCEDGVQNADETGIDCGGSCAACQSSP